MRYILNKNLFMKVSFLEIEFKYGMLGHEFNKCMSVEK